MLFRSGAKSAHCTFAVSHSKSTASITLNRYNFIPSSILMSFPQELDERLVNGCLLLSVVACYIWLMSCNCKDEQKRKKWRCWRQKWLRYSKIAKEAVVRTYSKVLSRSKKRENVYAKLLNDLVAIMTHIKESLDLSPACHTMQVLNPF